MMGNSAQNNLIALSATVEEVVNYGLQQCGVSVVSEVKLKNLFESELDGLCLQIFSDGEFFEKYERPIQKIHVDEELNITDIDIKINGNYLASLTDRVSCNLHIVVKKGEEEIASEIKSVAVLAFDQWPGFNYTPEILAAYILPNHPVVSNLLLSASQYLQKWGQDPALTGYQSNDPNMARVIAAAAFAAIQQKNVTYAEPPKHFDEFGQKIRLPEEIFESHLGTCMDMTLLYAACLEAIGLNPFVVMMKGHIFAGAWLIENSFSEMIIDDPSLIEKRMADGINELFVVECTAMCAGHIEEFEDAVKKGKRILGCYDMFMFALDISRARAKGIRPLPIRVKTPEGFVVEHKERKSSEVTSAPTQQMKVIDIENLEANTKATKQLQWERKLLDLSMRNLLINLRFTKALIPLLCNNVSELEDALADGEEFLVQPRPKDMGIGKDFCVEALSELGPFAEFIQLEAKRKRLHSLYKEEELNDCLTNMYRSAKTSLEENGASTLYLALGILRWVDTKNSENPTPRYAPIILLPIDVNRIYSGPKKGYSMRMRDEDAQINITLLEFLKQNYDMVIKGLNPLPTDDHGIDLPKIFAIIRHEIINMPMWDVLEAGFIGNFSFSQFVMWNDIHNHNDALEKNDIVRSFIKGGVDFDCSIPKTVETDEAYLPIAVDASQLRAINMAANNVNFVLHGPPGTGKSQTITAMVANALTKGKTVLFVAEKRAALEVVQKRLAALGIGDFCLELHSNKATKKFVLDQLKKNLEITSLENRTQYDKKIESIRRAKKELDSYVKQLHEIRPLGKSLKELIDAFEEMEDCNIEVEFSKDYVSSLDQGTLENNQRLLEQLVAAAKSINHPCKHPLSIVYATEFSQTLKKEIQGTVETYCASLESTKNCVLEFLKQTTFEIPKTKSEWERIYEIAKNVVDLDKISPLFFTAENIDKEFFKPLKFISEMAPLNAQSENYRNNWKNIFLQQDMDAYQEKYEEVNRKIFWKKKSQDALREEIQAFSKSEISYEQLPVIFAEIKSFQKKWNQLNQEKSQIPYEWAQILEKYPTENSLKEYKDFVKEKLYSFKKFADKILEMNGGVPKICMEQSKIFVKHFDDLKENEKALTNLLDIRFDNSMADWILGSLEACKKLIEHQDEIKEWIVYRQFDNLCKNSGLAPICAAYENGLSHEMVLPVYRRSLYKALILDIIESEPSLNNFTGSGFNEKVAQFKKMDDEIMALTKEEMYYKLTRNLPRLNESDSINRELNILRRAISSNCRGISIRNLFDQIPNVINKLTPCLLMSPISVAQFLSFEGGVHDIVIFDEASQLQSCKAVGVLARGKNAVVVGDPNQMPPTSFFAGNSVDEDNLDIEDLDSILDDCLALGMPSAHLKWHYRSHHESLIAFSNHEFYENSMLTFPSVNDRNKCVNMVKVDGFFNRKKGRVNEAEANAIVAEIKKRYKNQMQKNKSVGVVTFNITQQKLIEDLLAKEYYNDEQFAKWANDAEEPLFIKNLENVQGDERDVILFSIAFGPDDEGKISHNFGPLNREGGWKRLNVAASRAKEEMLVFSTMTSDKIDLRRTKSNGVEALKNFLEFAEKGTLHLSYAETHNNKSQGIQKSVCAEIEKAGFKIQNAVGHSKFKVDIAVINPYNENEYLMGIMLDGDSYRQSSNTKDREIAQQRILENLGWDVYRLWTMDWWDNRKKEIQKLLDCLNAKKKVALEKKTLIENSKNLENTNVSETALESVENEVEKNAPIENGSTENNTIENEISDKFENVLAGVIKSFAPEPNENFNATSNSNIKEELPQEKIQNERANTDYEILPYIVSNVEITDLNPAEYVLKNRMVEIAAKADEIVNVEGPICHERLVKKTLRAFNFSRATPPLVEATEKAIKKMNASSEKQNGIKFYWPASIKSDYYKIYRNDTANEKRNPDEICSQELKNAICVTLKNKGALNKDDLIKETIRTMGYTRRMPPLIEAVERGIKLGKKTGEILQDNSKNFVLQELLQNQNI